MTTEWIQIILQLGFPTATVIFLAWKGIPWLQNLNQTHRSEIRELIDNHIEKIEEKDAENREVHQQSMRIIEANTRAINSLAHDVGNLKETNENIRSQLDRTRELISWIKTDFKPNAD